MNIKNDKPAPGAMGRYANSLDPDSESEVYDSEFEALVRHMLIRLGDDPNREGLIRTPLRVAKAMDFLTSGYGVDADEVVKSALFNED